LFVSLSLGVGCSTHATSSSDPVSGKADDGDADAGTPDDGGTLDAGTPDSDTNDGGVCRSDKMTFDQSTGCRNDGFVEFCLPKGDDAAASYVHKVAPTIQCYPDRPFGGRANCDTTIQYLCMLPLERTDCVERFGAMTDAAWARTCDLAGSDAITEIVPTWFE
jgi:hypothetical protein